LSVSPYGTCDHELSDGVRVLVPYF
jgi:hypothetical protein